MQKDFHPSSAPACGVYITGLKLRNASWDATRQCIIELQETCAGCELPTTWLKPVEQGRSPLAEGSHFVYECPLLTLSVKDNFKITANVATSLPLPSDMAEDVLKQCKVSLVPMLCL